jgi:ribose 5-phosphate isomerase A
MPDLTVLAEAALTMIREGLVIGLGSGRAATAFVDALGRRVQQGFRVRCVPTSRATAKRAAALGIEIVSLGDVAGVDVTVDGADEVDPDLDLIKGMGGALVAEKIVASASRRLLIIVTAEKLVSTLGEHGVLPVEVVPFGWPLGQRRLTQFGFPSTLRKRNGKPFVTDNGNHILDCRVPRLPSPSEVQQTIRAIPGVVDTGLFLGMAHALLVETDGNVEIRQRHDARK